MPAVNITHRNTNTETIDETAGWRWERELGTMWKLEIEVFRADAQGVSLVTKFDEVELVGVTTGRLTDVRKGGPTWTLVVRSFEWDATKTEPLPGGTKKTGDDGTIITDRINAVSSWSVGSVSSFTNSLTFVFNHAFPHEAMRRVERNSPGELKFNTDQSVDFVQRRGTDKSGSITLSPSNGNLNGEITIEDKGREHDATHFRVIGAHEGEAQLFANLVPDDDAGNYTNEVTYTTNRWSNPGDTDWARWANKDVADQATLDEEAASLAEEIKETEIEASAIVEGVDIDLGDTVQVTKPEADLDRAMRVFRIVTKTVEDAPAGTVDEVLLSTRNVVRGDEADRIRDIQRFNVAFQGSSVILQGGGSRQPVNASLNAFESFRYPAVDFEHVVEVEVRGLPYRAYSSGGAESGTGTWKKDEAQFWEAGNTTDTATTTVIANARVPQAPGLSFGNAFTSWTIKNQSGTDQTYDWALINNATTTTLESGSIAINDGAIASRNHEFTDTQVSQNDLIQLEITSGVLGTDTADASNLGYVSLFVGANGTHGHAPDPGITEFASTTPSNCDLLVNGTTEATNIGSGEFVTTVDVTGALNQGQWNDIEVTSDSLGHITARVYAETYKQIGGDQ